MVCCTNIPGSGSSWSDRLIIIGRKWFVEEMRHFTFLIQMKIAKEKYKSFFISLETLVTREYLFRISKERPYWEEVLSWYTLYLIFTVEHLATRPSPVVDLIKYLGPSKKKYDIAKEDVALLLVVHLLEGER